jgi:2-polyprenyl-3-methyl-5-hydroxy-6-metoxy-1,4-benzoquinol methylase
MTLDQIRRDWESIADNDALWGILSAENKRGGKWSLDEFFKTGINEINNLVEIKIKELEIVLNWNNALDFGCGVGRLTQAMATYFKHCYGVDISSKMIELANKYNKYGEKCTYIVNNSDNLKIFSSDFFDFIYTTITLQHMARTNIKSYLEEFIRTLQPKGILVFQLISHLPLRYRLQPTRRLFSVLKKLGFSEQFLFSKLKLCPIRMSFIAESELVDFIRTLNGVVLKINSSKLDNGVISNFYFVTK